MGLAEVQLMMNHPDDRKALHLEMFGIARASDGEYVLDFCGRVGARPYFRFVDGEWTAVSVGPWDRTDDGRAIVSSKEVETPSDDELREQVQEEMVVQLRSYHRTPFDEPVEYVYGDNE